MRDGDDEGRGATGDDAVGEGGRAPTRARRARAGARRARAGAPARGRGGGMAAWREESERVRKKGLIVAMYACFA
jgi:hypothetical protein